MYVVVRVDYEHHREKSHDVVVDYIHTRGEKEEEEASWNGGRHRRTPLTTTQVSAAAAVLSTV